jgi:hypothetical protein
LKSISTAARAGSISSAVDDWQKRRRTPATRFEAGGRRAPGLKTVEQTFQFAHAPSMGVLPSHEQTGKFALQFVGFLFASVENYLVRF